MDAQPAPVKDSMIWKIFNLLFFTICFGLVAYWFSSCFFGFGQPYDCEVQIAVLFLLPLSIIFAFSFYVAIWTLFKERSFGKWLALNSVAFLVIISAIVGAVQSGSLHYSVPIGAGIFLLLIATKAKTSKVFWNCFTLALFTIILAKFAVLTPLLNLDNFRIIEIYGYATAALLVVFGALSFSQEKIASFFGRRIVWATIFQVVVIGLLSFLIWSKTQANIIRAQETNSLSGIADEAIVFNASSTNTDSETAVNTDGKTLFQVADGSLLSEDLKYRAYTENLTDALPERGVYASCNRWTSYVLKAYIEEIATGKKIDLTPTPIQEALYLSWRNGNVLRLTYHDSCADISAGNDEIVFFFDTAGNKLNISDPGELPKYSTEYSTDRQFIVRGDNRSAFHDFYIQNLSGGKKIKLPYGSVPRYWLRNSTGLVFTYQDGLFILDTEGNYKRVATGRNISLEANI